MPAYDITSAANERIKWLVRLKQRRHRDEEGVFVVEGPRLVGLAMASGLRPRELYVDGSTSFNHPGVVSVEPSVLDKASYRQSSQGVIGVFGQFAVSLDRIAPRAPALLLAVEAVEKPGNLGAILRTAAAVGADGLITIDDGTDVFNPNVVRSSTGALFAVPLAKSDLSAFGVWLAQRSIALIATAPGSQKTVWQSDLSRPCALLVGAEDRGLTSAALEIADEVVSIPMASDGVDSLNASVAAAVIAYEAIRQRAVK